MLTYFALLLGLVLVAGIVMFCCMYFFNTKFFDYGWKSASKTSDVQTVFSPSNIEINSNAVDIEIKSGSENKVVYTDGFIGIVKGIKHDDGTTEIPKSIIEIVNNENKSTINVKEPTKGWFSSGKSKLEIYINSEFLKSNIPEITINFNKGKASINLETYKSNVTFNSNNRANLTISSPVNSLTGNYEIGKLIATSDVGCANVTTKNGTLQINGNVVGFEDNKADVTVKAENANIKLNEVNGTVTYLGKNDGEASGGKLSAKVIKKSVTIQSRSFDAIINELYEGCNVSASNKGNLTIDKYVSNVSTKRINVNKGNVTINELDVNDIEITTTNGNINLNAYSLDNGKDNKINVKSTNGNINISAQTINNENKYYFSGTIVAQSGNGNIVIKDVYNKEGNVCIVNLMSTGKGKVVCYFEGIASCSSMETNSGELIADVKMGSAAFLNVIANNKIINLSGTTEFADKTQLTPIYNAESIENNPILTIVSASGKVQIKEF